jgi:phospholipid/cholesterol/gamma-HCH transport system ATP-binding protein
MIEFKNVSKAFGPKRVLDGMSFQVGPGEIVFLLGRSGVGKSVTLKHLVGLIRPDSGEIYVDGKAITGLSEDAFFDVRKKCGMVFQFPALIDSLTVYENVAFGLRAHALCPAAEERDVVRQKLALVGLADAVLEKYPSELSYGMQKRASIARTLAVQPSYLLFDEPTTGLDPVSTKRIHSLIESLSRKLQVASLVISHDMEGALSIADRILLIDKGKVVDSGTPAHMRQSKHPLTSQFLQSQK